MWHNTIDEWNYECCAYGEAQAVTEWRLKYEAVAARATAADARAQLGSEWQGM